MTLKRAQAGVKRVDDGSAKIAVWNETHPVTRPFLIQLTRHQIVFAVKHPLEEGARALTARHVLHATSLSKNDATHLTEHD